MVNENNKYNPHKVKGKAILAKVAKYLATISKINI